MTKIIGYVAIALLALSAVILWRLPPAPSEGPQIVFTPILLGTQDDHIHVKFKSFVKLPARVYECHFHSLSNKKINFSMRDQYPNELSVGIKDRQLRIDTQLLPKGKSAWISFEFKNNKLEDIKMICHTILSIGETSCTC